MPQPNLPGWEPSTRAKMWHQPRVELAPRLAFPSLASNEHAPYQEDQGAASLAWEEAGLTALSLCPSATPALPSLTPFLSIRRGVAGAEGSGLLHGHALG